MVFNNAFFIPRTSGRRLTPQTLAELSLPPTFSQLAPVWVSPGQAITDSGNEESYTDILTNITEIDEAISDQARVAAKKRSSRCFHTRFDAVHGVPERVESPRRPHNGGLRRTFAALEVQKEDVGCTTASEPDGQVELLFDAEIPDASDDDLASRGGFAPSTTFARISLSRDPEGSLVLSPTHELFDDSELKVQPTLAVDDTQDCISGVLNHYALPAAEHSEEIPPLFLSRREGRSLTRTAVPAKATASIVEEEGNEGTSTQIDYEQAFRRITGPSFLPGIDHLQNVNVRSAFLHYDDDIDNLFQATKLFLDDHHDGECGCLDGKPDVFRVPGENFLLTENEEDWGLSIQHPNAQSIFDVMDEVVCADMMDDDILMEAYSELSGFEMDGFVDIDLRGGRVPGPDDTAHSWQVWDPSMRFDITSHMNLGFPELEKPLYAPRSSSISSFFEDCSSSDVSDIYAIDSDSSWPAQSSELSYVDTETQQLISYTAFNQLLHMNEDEVPPRIRQDLDGTYASRVKPPDISEKCLGGGPEVRPSDSPDSSRSSSSVFYVRPGPSQQPQMPEHESRLHRRCPPHDLYSSNRSGQISKPRLTIKTQLVPAPQLLATVAEEEEEEEALTPLSSPSSDVSLEFADPRGFVVPLQTRRENFLDDCDVDDDDVDDKDDDLESMFTDAIWHASPDLALSRPDEIPFAIPTPPPASGRYIIASATLEQFEIEINSILALMFDCINRGQMHELAALSNHLYQALDAVPQDYPAMTAVRSLGVSVGILVERMVISSLAF